MYINAATRATYTTHSEVRSAFFNVSFPQVMSDSDLLAVGVYPVTILPTPDHNRATHGVRPQTIVGDVPTFIQDWEVYELSAGEIDTLTTAESAKLRQERNQKLSASDWTVLPDTPLDAAQWTTYRQALRDVPSQPGFPFEVQWPTPPQT